MVFVSRSVKFIAGILAVLISASSFAGPIEDYYKKINAADGLTEKSKLGCVTKVCGAAGELPPIPEKLSIAYDRIFNENFEYGLSKLIDLSNKQAEMLVSLQTNFNSLPAVKLSDAGQSIGNFFWAVNKIYDLIDFLESNGGWGYKLREGFETKLPNLSAAQTSSLKKMIEDFSGSREYVVGQVLESLDFQTALEELYPDQFKSLGFEKTKIFFAKEQLSNFEKLKKLWPEYPKPAPRILKALLEGKELSKAQVKALASSLGTLALMHVLQTPVYRELKLSAAELLVSSFQLEGFNRFKQQVDNKLEYKANLMISCREAVSKTLRIHFTEKDKKPAESIANHVRDSEIGVMNKLLSSDSSSQTEISDALKKVRFKFPLTTAEQVQQFRSALALELTDQKNVTSKLQNGSLELKILVLLINSFNNLNNSEIQSLCEDNNLDSYSDSMMPGAGVMNLGWESVRFPESGREVIAHEFGHEIFYRLSKIQSGSTQKRFEALKSCLASKHGDQPNRTDSSDEDFADWMAAQVGKDMLQKGVNIKNAGCSLLNYGFGKYGEKGGLTLKNPEGDMDVHSPSFFRMIGLEVETGNKLPNLCSALVSKVLPPQALQPCEF